MMFGQKAINKMVSAGKGGMGAHRPTAGRLGTSKSRPGVGQHAMTPGAKMMTKDMKRAMPNPAGVAVQMPPMPARGRRV